VLMPRMDQKSCVKSVITAGFTPVIIENELVGDELRTDLKALEAKINELKPEAIACIFSVSSCFAPRATDKIEEIAALCKKHDIFHLINNAYGLQSSKLCHVINQSARSGRVDVVVQSTDKNFMVPVGGAVIAAFDEKIISQISQFYPGRASSAQSLDVLITLLSMGKDGYRNLLCQRKECFNYLKEELKKLAEKYDEKVLETPNNPISIGFTLSNITTNENAKNLTIVGSMLFTRYVSGVRVVAPGDNKNISGVEFENFGSHSSKYPCPYLTAAAAIGITQSDIDCFTKRLEKVLDIVKNKQQKSEV
jgi:O-phospho-L-seryl-tRNASec:L-selenocysteinyl-tRNA synthase